MVCYHYEGIASPRMLCGRSVFRGGVGKQRQVDVVEDVTSKRQVRELVAEESEGCS